MSRLLELAVRVEAASPAYAMDEEIRAAFLGAEIEWSSVRQSNVYHRAGHWVSIGPIPAYSASIDAALTLIPEGMGDEIEITTLYQEARVTINMNHGSDGSPFYGSNECNSIPLAICAAALKAHDALATPSAPPPSNRGEQ